MTLDDWIDPNQDLLDKLFDLDTVLLSHISGENPLSEEKLKALRSETEVVQTELKNR